MTRYDDISSCGVRYFINVLVFANYFSFDITISEKVGNQGRWLRMVIKNGAPYYSLNASYSLLTFLKYLKIKFNFYNYFILSNVVPGIT